MLPIMRTGLVGAVGGESWHRLRRMMQPSFHLPKIAAFLPNMIDERAALVRRQTGSLQAGHPLWW